ncbi:MULTISPECIES: HalOD1 output domain-containing protein [Natrialbaceae]|uniref:HalOD1 output domain-containing protein n=1 Tax=Natrialbaceae TaxID=1644061 RepID=UPI00207C89C1|nr:HalOD1 output domain-containing protein [Natronococcus sp. CG52]
MSKKTDEGIMDGDDPTSGADTHWSQVAQRHYEPNGRGELTTAIVYAIAEGNGVSPTEVKSPPLYKCVDAAALEDAFFGPDVAGDSRQGVGTVEFQYTNYLVEIRSDGWIQVYEPTEADLS